MKEQKIIGIYRLLHPTILEYVFLKFLMEYTLEKTILRQNKLNKYLNIETR